jgi:thiosulfate/3-mercaptopyruvate sulfurtransferase
LDEQQRSKDMMQAWKQQLGIGVVAFFVAATAWAQGAIVDTAYVEQALARGAIVWDAREAADYAEGHIPGAVNFGWVGKVFRDPNREDLPALPEA